MRLEDVLYNKVMGAMSRWNEEDIYAVSFFVETNLAFSYDGYYNVPAFSVSFNTEADCDGAGPHDEKRWNYAFWRQEETPIIEPEEDSAEMKLLFDWYRELGLENIGFQSEEQPDPVGYPELVRLIAKVARRIQEEGFLKARFGREIPILIHDLEYADCVMEATAYANPNGEAADFLKGNWNSAEDGLSFPDVTQMAREILADKSKLERLLAVSPSLPEEYVRMMLSQIGEQPE